MMRVRQLVLRGFVLALTSACAGHLVYTSGPYSGRVVDADTQQPLAGAAVLAIWHSEVPVAPHGPAVDYHDALELVTDTNGEFTIPEKTHFTLLGKIREPRLVVYYPGYTPYPSVKARPQGKEVSASYKEKVFHFELSRLKTHKERLEDAGIPVYVDDRVPEEKMANLIRLVNTERNALGLQPVRGGAKTK